MLKSTKNAVIFVLLISTILISQEREQEKVKVMTLGVFHFNFPNLDVHKTKDEDKIDVLEEEYQNEIVRIVNVLKEFKPNRIAIEANRESQNKIDSLYNAYKTGKHLLRRNEIDQLGFRLANVLNIEKLECVDTWGNMYESLCYLFDDTSSRAKAFEHYYFNNPDSLYKENNSEKGLLKKNGIINNLINMNDPQTIKESLGPYLIGHFKYEEKENDYTGVDFETGRWFNRNLRIFRNIQRITKSTSDRILVIFGGGHMNILNYLFEASPEYELVSPEKYLRKIL